MPAAADTVFEIVTDLEHLHTWLPRAVTVDLTGGSGMPMSRVDDWLEQALDALATIVAEEASRIPSVTA
jgi:hypothetical protein